MLCNIVYNLIPALVLQVKNSHNCFYFYIFIPLNTVSIDTHILLISQHVFVWKLIVSNPWNKPFSPDSTHVFSAVVMNSSCNRKSCSICEPLFSISSCWTQACWPGQQCLRNAGWHSCHRGLFSFWTALQEWLSSHIVLAGGQETSSGKCKMGGVWNTLLPVLTGERSFFFTKHSFLYCFFM